MRTQLKAVPAAYPSDSPCLSLGGNVLLNCTNSCGCTVTTANHQGCIYLLLNNTVQNCPALLLRPWKSNIHAENPPIKAILGAWIGIKSTTGTSPAGPKARLMAPVCMLSCKLQTPPHAPPPTPTLPDSSARTQSHSAVAFLTSNSKSLLQQKDL